MKRSIVSLIAVVLAAGGVTAARPVPIGIAVEAPVVVSPPSRLPAGNVLGIALTDPAQVPGDYSGTSVAAYETTGGALVASTTTMAGGFYALDLPTGEFDIEIVRPSFLFTTRTQTFTGMEANLPSWMQADPTSASFDRHFGQRPPGDASGGSSDPQSRHRAWPISFLRASGL